MSPASSFALGKVIGVCLLIWFVAEALSWLRGQVARFIEAYGLYLTVAAAVAVLYLAVVLIRHRLRR